MASPPKVPLSADTIFDSGEDRFGVTLAAELPRPKAAHKAPSFQPAEGMRVAQYEIIRELGRGGMGVVVLARDTRLGRLVALKFLTDARNPEHTNQMIEEARTTARCSHENIVVIHEVDDHEGVPYMVLEYLEGRTARELFERGQPQPALRVVELLVPVVRALVRAHGDGIVHRDLKPENIFVTRSGTTKVLDFGVAKIVSGEQTPTPAVVSTSDKLRPNTNAEALTGTLPYMAPEQFGFGTVDHRVDLWAVGIILYELVAGRHPIEPLTPQKLFGNAFAAETPMPSVLTHAPSIPDALARVVDRCLAKKKDERYPTAQALLDDLVPLLPSRFGRQLQETESPFPGLAAFQEADADRFFGRSDDLQRAIAMLRRQPRLALVGPSGIGKSSLIRAGVLPTLRGSGEAWEALVVRPGRTPIASLAELLLPITGENLHERLRKEPGALGEVLRERARRKNTKVLLFVDQMEELYTLVPDASERAAFTALLSGVADDVAAPLRLVVSIRSDFLDRVAEDPRFLDEITRGLFFLQPVGAAGLREALVQPLEMRGYRYERPEMVNELIAILETTSGSLPLLQFAAHKLWEQRDPRRKLITEESYRRIGGIEGALATHANEILAPLPPASQKQVRAIFLRLVTPERTRAIVDVEDLRDLSTDPVEQQRLIDSLVHARLLVVQTRADESASVEIVHESLISRWPTLRRWLEESQEDAAFLHQLRDAASQWDARNRAPGLLWRGEAMEEARHFRARYRGELAGRERDYLEAVFQLANRSARVRRALVAATIVILGLVAVGAALASISIRGAEQEAKRQAVAAEEGMRRAQAAEQKITEQLREIRSREVERDRAISGESQAHSKLSEKNKELERSLSDAKTAQAKAQKEAEKALLAEQAAKVARDRAEKLAAADRARAERLERERGKVGRELR